MAYITHTSVGLAILTLCLSSALNAQTNHHRIPSIDYAIGNAAQVFHVRFEGNGTQPAEIHVLERLAPSDDDATVDVVSLPGAVPGHPFSIGDNHWLVGSVSLGATPAQRQGWISRVALQVAGGVCTGVQVVASAPCGNLDPYRVVYDDYSKRLWMLDAANQQTLAANYDATGALPTAQSWQIVTTLGHWSSRRAILLATPNEVVDGATDWWSPWQPNTFVRCTPGTTGLWTIANVPAPADLCTFVGQPGIDSMRPWTFHAAAGANWSLTHATAGVLASGTTPASGQVTQPATISARGLEGDAALLTIGDHPIALPILGTTGRSVGSTQIEVADLLCGPAEPSGKILPSLPLGMNVASCSAWLLVGWRSPATGQDPLVWQGDVAVVDLGSSDCLAIPFPLTAGQLLGEICTDHLPVPNDPHLNGTCAVVQYLFESNGTYCVSNIAVSRVLGDGALPSVAQRTAAINSWRQAVAPGSSALALPTILQSLQGR